MEISTALNLLFQVAEKFRGTREQHQRLFEAQQTVLEYLKNQNATVQNTEQNQSNQV